MNMKKFLTQALALLLCCTLCFAAAAPAPSKTTGDMNQVDNIVINRPTQPDTSVQPGQPTQPNPYFTIVNTTIVPPVPTEPTTPDAPVDPTEPAVPEAPEATTPSSAHQAAIDLCNAELQKLAALVNAIPQPVLPSVPTTPTEPEAPVDPVPTEPGMTELVQAVEQAKEQTKAMEEYFGHVTVPSGEIMSLTEYLETEAVIVDEFFPLAVGGFEEGCGGALITMSIATPYTTKDKVATLIGLPTEDELMAWSAHHTTVKEDGRIEVDFSEESLLKMQETTALMAVVSEHEAAKRMNELNLNGLQND